jgi:hypothetical protein
MAAPSGTKASFIECRIALDRDLPGSGGLNTSASVFDYDDRQVAADTGHQQSSFAWCTALSSEVREALFPGRTRTRGDACRLSPWSCGDSVLSGDCVSPHFWAPRPSLPCDTPTTLPNSEAIPIVSMQHRQCFPIRLGHSLSNQKEYSFASP